MGGFVSDQAKPMTLAAAEQFRLRQNTVRRLNVCVVALTAITESTRAGDARRLALEALDKLRDMP